MQLPATLTVAIFSIAAVVALLSGLAWWARILRRKTAEPIIELEKLVNCRSCGSLMPEGARKCAFCGSWQKQQPIPENK
ncbi:MAG: hypothetical protein ABSD99_12650 [Candidatus Bathyarchaeia archaeon]